MDAVPLSRHPTHLHSQCGPMCSQNVAYNQPFLPSLRACSSRVVPECFLHRPNVPFLQKAYTEDKERDLAAINLWRFCRQSDIEDWAWLADAQTPTADPPASVRSGSTIIDKSRQDTRPESDSGRERASLIPCQEDISTELLPKNKLKLVVFSKTRGQTSASARARANARTAPRASSQRTQNQDDSDAESPNAGTPNGRSSNARTMNTRTSNARASSARTRCAKRSPVGKKSRNKGQSEGQSQPLLPSPPWTPPKQGVVPTKPVESTSGGMGNCITPSPQQGDRIDNGHAMSPVSTDGINGANPELHEVHRALFHPDSGNGQGLNHEPTGGLETTLGRKDNGSNDSRIPDPASAPGSSLVSPPSRAAKPAVIEGIRKSARIRTHKRRNNP